MSMLAEPRRRKNYVLTPRGKPLYDDESRFGSKILQKMGWTKGKGLGAKESGDKDFIRVSFKSNSGGLGFEHRDDQWTEHDHGFNGLLQSLNAKDGEENNDDRKEDSADENFQSVGFGFKCEKKNDKEKIKVVLSGESLEEKSKKSKARVHYKKFTKGKDLSQYSEKDLANIFGKKALEIKENEQRIENSNFLENTSPTITDHNHVATSQIEYDQEQSSNFNLITDYFKRKMEDRKVMRKDSKAEDINEEIGNPLEAISQAPDEDTIRKKRKKDNSSKNKTLISQNGVDALKLEDDQEQSSNSNSITDYFKRKMEERKAIRKDIKPEDISEGSVETLETMAKADNKDTIRKKRKKDKSSTNETVIDAEELPATYFPVGEEKGCKKRKIEDEPSCETLDECNSRLSEKETDMNIIENKTQCQTKENVTTVAKNKSTILENNTAIAKDTPEEISDILNLNVSCKIIKGRKELSIDDDVKDKCKNFNIYTISAYAAEKFRHFEFGWFKGSNLAEINGYSFDKDIKLNITKNMKDESRILQLWSGTSSKYNGSRQKKAYKISNTENTKTAISTKPKIKNRAFIRSKHKRRSAFKLSL